MKKILVLTMSIVLVLTFAACGGKKDGQTTSSDVSQNTQSLVNSSETESTEPKYTSPVNAQDFSKTDVKVSDCIKYNDEKKPPVEGVLFTVTETVTDFKFVEYVYNFDTENYELGETLYMLSTFSLNQKLLINTTIDASLESRRGFCFTDKDGVIKYYSLSYDYVGDGDSSIIVGEGIR